MKRSILFSLILTVSFCGICPAGAGEIMNVTVLPEAPTTSDVINIAVSGTWQDSCVPDRIEVQMEHNDIYVDLFWSPLMRPCLLVISDWRLSTSVGPLPAGEYAVFVRLREVTEYERFTVFAVQGNENPWYWPPEAVAVRPELPTPDDAVSIALEGQWPDTCVPTGMTIARDGPGIFVDLQLDYPANTGCGAAITPWRLANEIGHLDAGGYVVYGRIAENPMVPPTEYIALTEFKVASTGEVTFYRFIPDESSVLQSGGFMGIQEIYSVEGTFGLRVNFDQGVARFVEVEALLKPESSFLPNPSLGELFNMENLDSTSVTETSIRFEGMTESYDVAPVVIEGIFGHNGVRLMGTIRPGCCDRFSFDLDGFAVPLEEPHCSQRPVMDFTDDCRVDIADFAVFARHWMECNLVPLSACWQ